MDDLEFQLNKISASSEQPETLVNNQTDLVLPLRVKEFSSDKEYFSFIKNVEKLIRLSPEYRLWLHYVREILGNNFCLMTHETMEEVSIEIHHVITLFDLVMIATDTKIMNRQEFTSFTIAEDVITMHYRNQVAYIPLVKTLHEKVHNGALKIPTDMIFGDWKKIEVSYYINQDIKKKIDKMNNVPITDVQITWRKDFYPGVVNRLEHNSENVIRLEGTDGNNNPGDIKKQETGQSQEYFL